MEPCLGVYFCSVNPKPKLQTLCTLPAECLVVAVPTAGAICEALASREAGALFLLKGKQGSVVSVWDLWFRVRV